MAEEILHHQRRMAGGRQAAPSRLCPRSSQFELCRPQADLPALRPVPALRPFGRGLSRIPLAGTSAACRQGRGAVLPDLGCPENGSRVMTAHRRIRPFNTRETYPEQKLDNDLCQAVVARGTMVFLRGQVSQDLDSRETLYTSNARAQTEK